MKNSSSSKTEKIVSVSLITFVILLIGILVFMIRDGSKTYRIRGTVVQKFRTEAGYKVSSQPHVVVFSDSLQRNVDVQTTWNCYANLKEGQRVTFNLTRIDLNR